MTQSVERFLGGFDAGLERIEEVLSSPHTLETFEAIRELPAGSLIRDAKGRLLFRTNANGWVSTAATHFSSVYLRMPIEVIHHGDC